LSNANNNKYIRKCLKLVEALVEREPALFLQEFDNYLFLKEVMNLKTSADERNGEEVEVVLGFM